MQGNQHAEYAGSTHILNKLHGHLDVGVLHEMMQRTGRNHVHEPLAMSCTGTCK